MSLVEHAKEELKRAGLFEKDSDYEGMLGDAVLELIEKFAAQGHSGFSAYQTIAIFERLAKFQTLTPITSDPAEWMCVSEHFEGKSVHQNLRNPAVFSNDAGKTWYNIDELHKKLSFRIKRNVRWFFIDLGRFIKYNIFRAKRPVVNLSEFAAIPAQAPEDNSEKPSTGE